MKKYINILKNVQLFYDINESDIESLLKCLSAHVKTYEENTIIINEGDPITDIGLIVSGRAEVQTLDYFGNTNIMASLSPGDSFAEIFVSAGLDKSLASVVAKEKSEVMFINFSKLLSSCSSTCIFHQLLIKNLIKNIAEKNLLLKNKIDFISKRNIESKIMSYLLSQAKNSGNSKFIIPFDRQGLADYLCVDRSALSRVLSKLKKDGFIDYNKNQFSILKKYYIQ